jgi:hypothetical protein
VNDYTITPLLEGSRVSRAIDTSCMPWDERIGTAPIRGIMAIPSVLVDDVYPYIDNLSENWISGAFKFAFKEEHGASQINDSLLNFGVNPRDARDISLGFEMFRRTFLDSYAVGSLGGLAGSGINALATKGRNIFQNIGVIPDLVEEAPSLFSIPQRSVLWSVKSVEPRASFGYGLGTKSWTASIGAAGERSVVQEWTATSANKVHAKLTPYGGPGGGHHIHMKSAYKSHPLYNLNEALCLSNQEMARLGIKHELANKAQRTMCTELKRSGKEMTRIEMNRISVEALVAGGADRQLARSIVARSQWDLKAKGVRMPTDMPWGGKK